MNELVHRLGGVVTTRDDLERVFEASIGEWSRLAFRVAFSVLRQKEDAEDVAQEALAQAHRQLRQLRDQGRLRAWLVRMTWRMALDRRASDSRRLVREGAVGPSYVPPSSEDILLEAERSVRLWDVIDELPEKLRIVVVLCAIEEHDIAGVAATLEIPEGTVKRRLFDARQLLRKRLS